MHPKKNIFVLISLFAVIAFANSAASRLPRGAATCGKSKTSLGLIVRGESFNRGDFPWIVALLTSKRKPPAFFCAGTLISSTFVVSAAHCILQKGSDDELLPREVRALFGAHDLNDHYESERFALSPKKITIHKDWNQHIKSYEADISLLEFEEGSIHFNNYVQPICLWDSDEEPSASHGIVTGWGRSEDLSKRHETIPKLIEAPIIANDVCLPSEEGLAGLAGLRTFCAGLKNGAGVCTGDSGGGLFIKVNNLFFFKGIVSSSMVKDSNCDVSRNAIYTNVLKFRDWITEKTGGTIISFSALKQLVCTFITKRSTEDNSMLKTCAINQTIDDESFIFKSPIDNTVEEFYMSFSKKAEFLPEHIGEKLPNLKEFVAEGCGLKVIRDFYFKNMRNLQKLYLSDNKIALIEASAFDDLVNVKTVALLYNLIETLDEKLFSKMSKLELIGLNNNKIKFLSPTTFRIPGGKLKMVFLKENVCIDQSYEDEKRNMNRLQPDLRAKCAK